MAPMDAGSASLALNATVPARQMSPANPGWRVRAPTYRRGGKSSVTRHGTQAARPQFGRSPRPSPRDTTGAEIPSRNRIGTDHGVKRSLDRYQCGKGRRDRFGRFAPRSVDDSCRFPRLHASSHGFTYIRRRLRQGGTFGEPPKDSTVSLFRGHLTAELHELARCSGGHLTRRVPLTAIDPRGIEDHRLGPPEGPFGLVQEFSVHCVGRIGAVMPSRILFDSFLERPAGLLPNLV